MRKVATTRARFAAAAGTVLLALTLVPSSLQSAEAAAPAQVERVFGADRIATAIALSQRWWQTPAGQGPGVVLAVSVTPADALSAAPLAASLGGPLLLSQQASLRQDVENELARLNPSTIILMGGTAALSKVVEDRLVEVFGADRVERLAGEDRFATAARASERARTAWAAAASDALIIALGQSSDSTKEWADALGAGALGGYSKTAVLLVRGDAIPAPTQAAIDSLNPATITIVGGEAAISAAVADALGDADTTVVRLSGPDRYGTAAAIATASESHGASTAGTIAVTGLDFPDGLAAGPAAVRAGRVLALIHGDDLDRSPAGRDYLASHTDASHAIVGGPAAISLGTERQLRGVLGDVPALKLTLVGTHSVPMGVHQAADDDRIFVTERAGRVVELGTNDVLLDISSKVSTNGERGLLGLAFHPAFATNGRYFIHYSRASDGDTVVSEFLDHSLSPSGAGERILLTVHQPATNHNGGSLAFGPDGMLYLALGDGGGSAARTNSQNTNSRLGSILRIDTREPGLANVADANPYATGGGDPFVWSKGLRNPYRGLSWDPITKVLYVADVGEGSWEEINAVPATEPATNYGWPIREGAHCFSSGCSSTGLTDPIYEYANDATTCSITGGEVYRGSAIGELRGHYFFGDFCAGSVGSILYRDGALQSVSDWTADIGPGANIFSFGKDAAGELYVTTSSRVYRIDRA